MADIPITFTHEGKEYNGVLNEINGAGGVRGAVWHLLVDRYYWGQLHFYEDRGFVFNSQLHYEEMKYLGEVFGEAVTLWYG